MIRYSESLSIYYVDINLVPRLILEYPATKIWSLKTCSQSRSHLILYASQHALSAIVCAFITDDDYKPDVILVLSQCRAQSLSSP